jgi:hypothetical protein
MAHDSTGNVLTDRTRKPDRDTSAGQPDGDVRALTARRCTDSGRNVAARTWLILWRDGHVEDGVADHEEIRRVPHRS